MAVRLESKAEPIPGYRLIERLGGGGFGEVWKAEAPGGLFKAIKFVYGELDSVGGDSERAEQELKAIKRVQSVRHPYILSLERYDIIDGQLIIVMELADRNLWDRFKECRAQGLTGIPREELLGYLTETAEALDLMNGTYQLQHLDIKPQNLFLVHNHIKVADFGLVKDLEGMAASVTGGVTPVYAAPETFDGWVSRFSDQYSLAIVYQELLTGSRPFTGNNIRQLVLQHLQGTPNLTSLPPADRPIIARGLAKSPDGRYPTCREMLQALAASAPAADVAAPETGLLLSEGQETPLASSSFRKALASPPTGDPAVEPPLSAPYTGTQTGERATRWMGGLQVIPAAPTPGSRPPSSIATGEGTLLPALLIGLGGTGLAVLRQLRQTLNALLPQPGALGHLHYLFLDTDPDAVRAASRGSNRTALGNSDVLLTRLHRPSHYLKARDGRPDIDAWFDVQMLYRIPRTQTTAGCRALGRLAFCDHFRAILQRLRAELEACGDPEAIKLAARQTRLGVRSMRPRIYVVASLAGGTGSGMFLDVAYVSRTVLRELGQGDAEVVGVFLVPTADRAPSNPLPLGNACAALKELAHFAAGVPFTARYLARDSAVQEHGAPFARCLFLPLTPEADETPGTQLAMAAEFLARDLCTGLGPAADQARSAVMAPAGGLTCQTFGLYKLAFPRRDLIARAGRGLCRRLVEHWLSKDGRPVREAAQAWIGERWSRDEYGPEGFIERLQAGCEEALGEAPAALFAHLIEPVSGRAALDPTTINDVLTRLDEELGRPTEETLADQPAHVQQILRDAGDKIVEQWGAPIRRADGAPHRGPHFSPGRRGGGDPPCHRRPAKDARASGAVGPRVDDALCRDPRAPSQPDRPVAEAGLSEGPPAPA